MDLPELRLVGYGDLCYDPVERFEIVSVRLEVAGRPDSFVLRVDDRMMIAYDSVAEKRADLLHAAVQHRVLELFGTLWP